MEPRLRRALGCSHAQLAMPSTSQNALADPPYRSFVEVSLPRIRANFHAIAEALKPETEIMPVVKANAYGHGAVPVAQALTEAGAHWLAVSNAGEGAALRSAGIADSTRIVVMAGVLPFEWPLIVEHGLTPVLHRLEEFPIVESLAESTGKPIAFHIKLDTGLSRLGLRDDISTVAKALLGLRHSRFEGAMTHFASAANLASTQTTEQLQAFERATGYLRDAGLPPFLVHVDATNSIHLTRHETPVHLIRPGHAVYGYVTEPHPPAPTGRLHVKPALSWKARILLVKDLPSEVAVGYGAGYRTKRPTRIAVLAVGYSDGYPHQLSNHGTVLVNGHPAPILGAVSMDVTTIDVTGIPGAVPGLAVTLLGREGDHELDAIQIGRKAGTISYAILCNIHERVPRIYLDDDAQDS